jgi:general secretion pathway protein A
MYLDYELRKFLFRTNPDPKFLWFGEKHKAALSFLKYGMLKRDGFLLLTGDVGTGKTSLIKHLLKSTDASAIIIRISNPMMPDIDLALTVIGTFEEFSFSKLLNPFTPAPFFERTA